MSQFFMGLDLGQAQDFTAIVIVQRLQPKKGEPSEYHIPHLQRFLLGTPYTRIAERVKELMDTEPLKGKTALIVDETGVGKAVIDLLKKEGAPCLRSVSIHGGDSVTDVPGGYRVPKRDLVGVLQVLLQNERLKIARDLPESSILVQELLNFKAKIDPATAHDSYGAWRDGDHDDLVLAAALAVWYAETKAAPFAFEFQTAGPRPSMTTGYCDEMPWRGRGGPFGW